MYAPDDSNDNVEAQSQMGASTSFVRINKVGSGTFSRLIEMMIILFYGL